MSPTVPAVPAPVEERPSRRWRTIGILLGVLAYIGMVVLDIAGFGEALPFVVIPPVLVGLIGGGVLLGGGQHGRRAQPTPRPVSEYGHPQGSRALVRPPGQQGPRMTVSPVASDPAGGAEPSGAEPSGAEPSGAEPSSPAVGSADPADVGGGGPGPDADQSPASPEEPGEQP